MVKGMKLIGCESKKSEANKRANLIRQRDKHTARVVKEFGRWCVYEGSRDKRRKRL